MLLRYDPMTKQLEQLMSGLQFANGVAISQDQAAVFVAETGNYRVLRYDLRTRQSSVFADNLPGFPDGLNYDDEGLLWVSLPNRRNAMLDRLGPYPFLREVVYKLPPGLQPQAEQYGLVIALDRDGNVVRSLHDPTGRDAWMVTNFVWQGDTAYVATIGGREVGIYER